MTPFTYHRPSGLADAVALLEEGTQPTRIIAGGQSLLLWMKDRLVRPERLMSVVALPGMQLIRHAADGGVEIGAATTYATLARTELSGWQTEIAAVAGNLADRSVRSLGTIGGALCDANPRYDMPTLVVGSDASLTIAAAAGTRKVKAADFFDPAGGTVLRPSDLLLSISFPPTDRFDALAFEKFRHRVFEAAVVTICCAVKLEATGEIGELRIAAGALEKAPRLAAATASALIGVKARDVDVPATARAAANELLPEEKRDTRHSAYQAELVISLTVRALTRAFSQQEHRRCPK